MHTQGSFRPLIALMLTAKLLFLTPLASASNISLQGSSQLQFSFENSQLLIKGVYSIQNNGDETAKDAFPALTMGSWAWTGEPRNIDQNSKGEWQIAASVPGKALACAPESACENPLPVRGRHPLVITHYYQDVAGYKYSGVHIQDVVVGDLTGQELLTVRVPPLEPTLKCSGDGEEFTCRLSVRNTSGVDQKVTLNYLVPRELRPCKPSAVLDVSANQIAEESCSIKNFSGLPGSRYVVFAMLQWGNGEVRNSIHAHDQVLIEKPRQWAVFSGAALLLLLVLGSLYYFLVRKRSAATGDKQG